MRHLKGHRLRDIWVDGRANHRISRYIDDSCWC